MSDLVTVDRLLEAKLRVLDVGAGPDSIARKVWPEAVILTLDADPDLRPDLVGTALSIPQPDGSFDRVLASHVLEHIEYGQGYAAVCEMARVLAPGGELHVMVPSLEWAARQVLSERMSPITIAHLYGLQSTPWQYHKAGYTLMGLRGLLAAAGLKVVIARRAVYQVSGADQNGEPVVFDAEQHYVVGVKT